MNRIPTKLHGVADYATSAMLMAAPSALGLQGTRGGAVLRAAGGGVLALSLVTDYELGLKRLVPMRAHLALDAAVGLALATSPWTLGTRRGDVREWIPALLVGLGDVAGAAITSPTPSDAGGAATAPTPAASHAAPGASVNGTQTAAAAAEAAAGSSAGGGSEVPDAASAPDITTAAAPDETPGPSVTPPASPGSETERAEAADAGVPDPELLDVDPTDPIGDLVAQEEAAAAAEAAMIGGVVAPADGDPSLAPVLEAGGGEAEGFELAEADLVENASHGDGGGNPLRDAFTAEIESDAAGAVYGEPDEVDVTEVVRDPDAAPGDDDPGAGPGIAAER